MSRDIELLRNMVSIPSLSGEEEELARFLVSEMELRNMNSFIDAAGNAVGIRGDCDNAERHLLLLGHMDTVAGKVPVRLEDDKLYGRGTVDAKGPLAAFISAVGAVEVPGNCSITVVGAVEEEANSSKGAHFVRNEYAPDACIIGEPSGWDGITLGYKGRLSMEAVFTKDVSHSAGKDSTAFDCAVTWWYETRQRIENDNNGKKRLFDQILPSLNHVESTSDGLHESVTLCCSFRLPPGFDQDLFISEIHRGQPALQAARIIAYEPTWQNSRSTSLARSFSRAIIKAGNQPRWKLKTGTSDMNVVGPAWQCPIVAYGPGDSSLDHTPEEHIQIDEYINSISVLKTAIESWFSLQA